MSPALSGERMFEQLPGVMFDSEQNPDPLQMLLLFCSNHAGPAAIPPVLFGYICNVVDFVGPAMGLSHIYDVYAQ